MLLLCNGPYKSGSTWLYNLLQHTARPKTPPSVVCTQQWKHPSLLYHEIIPFAESHEGRSATFLSKHHFTPLQIADLAAKAPDRLLFFSIERDLADALVSAWHHHQNKHSVRLPFPAFYWRFGRANALGIVAHNRVMRSLHKDQVCILQYERLLEEPIEEVKSLIAFLGERAVTKEPQVVLEATSIEKLRSKYDDTSVINGKAFFRSGTAGEGARHVHGSIERDLRAILSHPHDPLFMRLFAKLQSLRHPLL